MTNIDTSQLTNWIGKKLVDTDGSKIGEITDVYQDDETGRPEWIAVSTGLFGSRVSFVPLEGATSMGDDIQVRYSKDQVKDAPNAEADGHLSPEEEERLYAHYGMGTTYAGTAGMATDRTTTADMDTGRTGTADLGTRDDATVVRSEEEADIRTREREAGRVRLRKWVETEHVDQTVPVRHEEVRVEREPIAGGERVSAGEIGEDQREVVLHDEEVVVDKHAEAKERIRLETDAVVEQEQVDVDLRKEHVEVDEDAGTRRR